MDSDVDKRYRRSLQLLSLGRIYKQTKFVPVLTVTAVVVVFLLRLEFRV